MDTREVIARTPSDLSRLAWRLRMVKEPSLEELVYFVAVVKRSTTLPKMLDLVRHTYFGSGGRHCSIKLRSLSTTRIPGAPIRRMSCERVRHRPYRASSSCLMHLALSSTQKRNSPLQQSLSSRKSRSEGAAGGVDSIGPLG